MTFHTTRWTLVRHATGHSAEGRQALSDLCAAYYKPVVAFMRREGFEEDAARDLAHERERGNRLKRGGGTIALPLDAGTDTSPGVVLADHNELSPDKFFDRQWALAVLERAFAALETEREAAGKDAEFARLKPWLTGDAVYGEQAEAARGLGLSEGALKVTVHRLRRRFRELLKAEIAQTLDMPEAVEEEMRHLFSALGSA